MADVAETRNLMSMSLFSGENVVRGDKESVKNLLEIFDGLLEYLNEEINDGSPNSGRKMKLLLFPHLFLICFYFERQLKLYDFKCL